MVRAAFNLLLGGFCNPEDSNDVADCPFERIVIYTASPVIYSLRYYSKLRQRTKLETVSELRTLPSNRRCSSFLNYDLLMLIVRELHFVDVINLSLASRDLRDALFPKADVAARTQALRSYTCEGSKYECSKCGIQICTVRRYERVTRSLLIQ